MMSSGLNGCSIYRDAIQAEWNDGWTLWWARLQEEQILMKHSQIETAIAIPVLCGPDDACLSSYMACGIYGHCLPFIPCSELSAPHTSCSTGTLVHTYIKYDQSICVTNGV